MTPQAPERFAPVNLLKQGPHSAVHLVREEGSGRLLVARRIAFPPKAELAEARLSVLRSLRHPGLQPLESIEYDSDSTWVISPFVAGWPVDVRPPMKRLALSWTMLWTTQVLELLEYLHGQDPPLVLGRIEPADLVLAERGAVLVDLGCYERLLPKSARAEALVEPSPFMALEQVVHWGFQPASDVFSIGAVAWWMLTGKTPPDQALPPEDVLPRLQELAPALSEPLLEPFAYMLCMAEERAQPVDLIEALSQWTWQPRPRPAIPPGYVIAEDKSATPWLRAEELAPPQPRPAEAVTTPLAARPPASVRSATTDPVPLAQLTPDPIRYRPLARLSATASLLQEDGHLRVGRRVAPAEEQTPEQVEAELQGLLDVKHAALQKTVQTLCLEDAFWVISEYVAGHPWHAFPSGPQPSYGIVARWMAQLLEGVQVLHVRGLAIGRIEVSDVVLGPDGPVLVDLRFTERVRAGAEGESERRLTSHGDPSSDVRSIVALGYWLLTGCNGFAHNSREYTAMQVKVTQMKDAMPGEMRKALLRMLHNEESRRPRSVTEALELLQNVIDKQTPFPLPAVTAYNPVPWLVADAPVLP
ncbi:MAG: protein kinase [Candidatus Xenobia bacterium]